jgi:hypothetical protein
MLADRFTKLEDERPVWDEWRPRTGEQYRKYQTKNKEIDGRQRMILGYKNPRIEEMTKLEPTLRRLTKVQQLVKTVSGKVAKVKGP